MYYYNYYLYFFLFILMILNSNLCQTWWIYFNPIKIRRFFLSLYTYQNIS